MAGQTNETIAPEGIFSKADLCNDKSPSSGDEGASHPIPSCPKCGNKFSDGSAETANCDFLTLKMLGEQRKPLKQLK